MSAQNARTRLGPDFFTPLPGLRVGIQSNYCPATPGQLISPDVFDLATGVEAGNVGGPDPAATYMAVSQTEAVMVPPDVDPWVRAFAAGQQALSRRADRLPAAATILRSKGFSEEQIRHALAGDGQELHSMLE